MLHKAPSTILPETLTILETLQRDPFLDDFFLVGGTALALQIGHRQSIDLDFFTLKPFENQELGDYLIQAYDFNIDYISKNTIKGFIQNVKVDFLTHGYILLKPFVIEDGLKLASIEDIGAMKLNAISHSGTRQKDFYDLYFILEYLSLDDLVHAYKRKYPNSNAVIPLKAINWFNDIDFEIERPLLAQKISFKQVEKRLKSAVNQPRKVFRSGKI